MRRELQFLWFVNRRYACAFPEVSWRRRLLWTLHWAVPEWWCRWIDCQCIWCRRWTR